MLARPVVTLALLAAIFVPRPSVAGPEVYLLGELPVLRSPMSHYTEGRDNLALPVTAGLRASLEWPTGDKRRAFGGVTLRAGATGSSTAAHPDMLLQARVDAGYRRMFVGGARARPFLELGLGIEAVRVGTRGESPLADLGAGPCFGLGWRLGGDTRRGVLGARLTSALIPRGYHTDSDDFENDTYYGYTYMPSNVTLALVAGRVF